ncbi:MAG TPA: 1-acyl-sn-glycerol-3-phosphate acyltransferase [Rhodobacteraceae bacterium]|nr:1-acyl-sn-glycerol-3-phosphate acyltransferase [Paracoccaceae bacterium]
MSAKIAGWVYAGAAHVTGNVIALFTRFLTAARVNWVGIEPIQRQRVYYANHTSNADFVLLWTVLPAALRARTRPVAAADYWLRSRLRAFAGRDVFRAVLIDRNPETRTDDPVDLMCRAIDQGASLILFPEGKRNMGPDRLLPFKTGLYHLALARPEVDLVPTWLENLNHVMPKGEVVPIPLICSVSFGAPLHLAPGEDKAGFLARAHGALLALADEVERKP